MSDRPRLYLSPPHLSGDELAQLTAVINSNWIAPVGPALAEFERLVAERAGVGHAVAVSSGTAAIHLALRCLGISPGDEVLCSTLTFCASANPITYEGAAPVFIDSDRESWNLDPNLVADELEACAERGKLPRAIVAVDVFGQSADLDAIRDAADRYEVPVLEDAAEALGADYRGRPVGASAWASVFSFNGNKMLTAGGGGVLCSDDGELLERARHLATQARDPAPHYEHTAVGFNYRMSNVLAAVGVAQMGVLDERVAARRRNFAHYERALGSLPGVSLMPEAAYGRSSRWLTVVRIDPQRFGGTTANVRERLEAENIESRPVWKPLHLQPVFAGARRRGGEVAEAIFADGLCLPSGSAMTEEDLDRVCAVVASCCRSAAAA